MCKQQLRNNKQFMFNLRERKTKFIDNNYVLASRSVWNAVRRYPYTGYTG